MSGKVELWRGLQTEGDYSWMVYEHDGMRCYWFEHDQESEARSLMATLRNGKPRHDRAEKPA